jgi:hypothetical protein
MEKSSINPVPASILAYIENGRRNGLQCSTRYKSGCDELDDNVLLGGFERGTVVGISSEEEDEFGLLVCTVLFNCLVPVKVS